MSTTWYMLQHPVERVEVSMRDDGNDCVFVWVNGIEEMSGMLVVPKNETARIVRMMACGDRSVLRVSAGPTGPCATVWGLLGPDDTLVSDKGEAKKVRDILKPCVSTTYR